MSTPLVVNTLDGTVWTRRAVTPGGLALYAVAGVRQCPEYVMATLPELAEHGIVGTADALPVPVGPKPQTPRPIAYTSKRTEAQLLLADRAERQRAAEWPWDMWCRRCLVNVTSHRTEADALEAADQHVKLSHAPQAEVHQLMTAGGLAELERLRARVAELESGLPVMQKALFRALDRVVELETLLADATEPDVDDAGRTYAEYHPQAAAESADRWTKFFAPTQALTIEADASPSTPPRYGICTRPGCEHLGMFHGVDVCRTHVQKDGEPVRYCDCSGFVAETGGAL